jgi:predicted short-subunit dehydrogenase-like oxidoreductase (DUF2520 family)
MDVDPVTPAADPRATGPAAEHPARLRVGVVGVGRAGAVVGAALARGGHLVVAASGVSEASVARAASLLPGVPLLDARSVALEAELLILAVPDDAIEPLVEGLVATGALRPGTLVAHLSGAHGVGVLDAAARAGALPVALHPVMTFTGAPEDLARVVGIPFGVTSSDALRPVAEALVVDMGGEPVWVPEESRALYHAALTHGANHLVTLVNQTTDLLRSAGVQEPALMVAPLLGSALENAIGHGDAGLTGPVLRGDAGTVAAHLKVLAATSPEALRTYLTMARATADRALAAGLLDPAQAEGLLDVLGTPNERTRS